MKAYREAGHKGMTCRKLQQPHIIARIAELRAEIAARNKWNRDRIIDNLAAIAESDPSNIVKIGSDGKMRVDIAALRTLRGATVEIDPDMTIRIKFDANTRRGAVNDIAKICGLLTTQITHEFANKSDSELLALAAAEGIALGAVEPSTSEADDDPADAG